jgi:hypothetical protein
MGNKSRCAIKAVLLEWNLQFLRRQAVWDIYMDNAKIEAIHSEWNNSQS